MAKGIRKSERVHEQVPVALGEWIHAQVRASIERAVLRLLKAAPISKSAVSRVVATLKGGLEAWRTRSLDDLGVIYIYLDGFALRVRSGGKVVSTPVLGVVGILPDGRKHLLALELC